MDSKKDIFDCFMSLKIFKCVKPFYTKHKEILLYVLFGGFTTLISILSFTVLYDAFNLNEHLSNVVSWIFAVSFAFLTNRAWVFESKTSSIASFFKQMFRFFSGRLLTLGVEEMIVLVFISLLNFNALLVKIIAQFVILVLNFLISKFLVFNTVEK